MHVVKRKKKYNEDLDNDIFHLPLFSNYIRNKCSDIINVKGGNVGDKNSNNPR